MSDLHLLVDTKTFLALISAGGRDALDHLFRTDQRILLTREIFAEMDRAINSREIFLDWFHANNYAGGGNASGRVGLLDFDVPDDYRPDMLTADGKNKGEQSLLYAAEHKNAIADAYRNVGVDPSSAKFRILADDQPFYNYVKSNVTNKFSKAALDQINLHQPPYLGSGEFMGELLINDKISAAEYNS